MTRDWLDRVRRDLEGPEDLLDRIQASRRDGVRTRLPDGAPARLTRWPLLAAAGFAAALAVMVMPGTHVDEGDCMRTGIRKLLPVSVFGAAIACANEPSMPPDSLFQEISRLEAPVQMPARLEYRATRWTDGEVESYQGTTVATFDLVRVDGEAQWLGVSTVEGPFIGVTVDTMRFAVESLNRIYHARARPETRGTWLRQIYHGDSVANETLRSNGEWSFTRRAINPLDYDLGLTPFYQLPQGMAVAMALPVEEHPFGILGSRRYQLVGRETVTVPAGTFECWRVDFLGWGTHKVWVAVDRPLLVKFEWGSVPDRFESVLTSFSED